MCKVNQTSTYRRKKNEILSDKNLKEVVETKFSVAEKEIENKWREVINKGDKDRKDKEFIKHPRVIKIDDKQQIEVHHKYDEKKRTVDIYDLVFLETYKPKIRCYIYIYYFLVEIAIIIMMVMRLLILKKSGNEPFVWAYLFFYIVIVGFGIREKMSRSIFLRNKNEPDLLSCLRLFFLQDSDINSGATFTYIWLNVMMLLIIDYQYMAKIGTLNIEVCLFSISASIIFLNAFLAILGFFSYLFLSGAILIPLVLIFLFFIFDIKAWPFFLLIFALIEWVLTKDFWQLMPEESVPKFIKNPSDKINMIISRNLNKITIMRLLCYVVIYLYLYLYLSEKYNLVELFITKGQVVDAKLIKIVNKSLYIIITIITMLVSRFFGKLPAIKMVKGNIYDKIYRDTIEYSSVSPSIIKKVELSISHVDKIEPKLLVKNMEDLPKETTVFIEKVDKSKKTCTIVVVMPDLTVHSGIVEFEP